jgi:hypothetical protein
VPSISKIASFILRPSSIIHGKPNCRTFQPCEWHRILIAGRVQPVSGRRPH